MQTLAILTKKHRPAAHQAGLELKQWLESRGLVAHHLENEP